VCVKCHYAYNVFRSSFSSGYTSWKIFDIERSRRVSCCQHSDTVSVVYRDQWMWRLRVYFFAIRIHLMMFRSNDVDLAQSAASPPRLSASGCSEGPEVAVFGGIRLCWRRVPASKKKIDESAIPCIDTRTSHSRACLLSDHRFLVSERAGVRVGLQSFWINLGAHLYALYAEHPFIIQILKNLTHCKINFQLGTITKGYYKPQIL